MMNSTQLSPNIVPRAETIKVQEPRAEWRLQLKAQKVHLVHGLQNHAGQYAVQRSDVTSKATSPLQLTEKDQLSDFSILDLCPPSQAQQQQQPPSHHAEGSFYFHSVHAHTPGEHRHECLANSRTNGESGPPGACLTMSVTT